jgi:L-ribulose-5-phosphate 4-epimerase
MSNYSDLQEAACEANRQLPVLGLVVFTFGNVSVADQAAGLFAIKPSGVPYAELTPSKMVVVDFDGNHVKGKLRPSSDSPTHALLYRHWKKIGSIVHTHSLYATAWAQSQRPIPLFGTTHADHNTVDIPCTPPMSETMISGEYEKQTAMQILDHFRQLSLSYEDVEMVLVGSHAPFTWGKDAEKALYHSAVLEYIAQLAYLTEQIRKDAPRLKEALIQKHHTRKHGPDSYYGQ